jgi:hypothetical protein
LRKSLNATTRSGHIISGQNAVSTKTGPCGPISLELD